MTIKWYRIQAILIRHLYLYKRSLPRLMDIFFWPVIDLLVWGFLSLYLSQNKLGSVNIITVLLGALLFWDFLNNSQRSVSIAFLEDVWERNIINIFVTPLKVSEFILSTFLLGVIRVFLVGVTAGTLAFVLYHFNIFQFGVYLIPFLANLLFFGWVMGLVAIAIIMRFGASAQVLAFAFIFLVQPFSAVFYPVSALPGFAQGVAYAIPVTYVFEGMRSVVLSGSFSWQQFITSLFLNILYGAGASVFFYAMFRRAKARGALLKLED